jgi:hypothetical protein
VLTWVKRAGAGGRGPYKSDPDAGAVALSPPVEDTAQPIAQKRQAGSLSLAAVWSGALFGGKEGRKEGEGEDARRGDRPTQGERVPRERPQNLVLPSPAVLFFFCSQAARACSDRFSLCPSVQLVASSFGCEID